MFRCALFSLLLLAGIAGAKTLEVGPGKAVASLAEAYAKAEKGDIIKVYPLRNGAPYERVAMLVGKPGITFLGVPDKSGTRVKISGKGFNYTGQAPTPRAIFQFDPGAEGCVLEGFELCFAHNDSHNGAGVRINQANHITVRNCEVHHNDMGTQSNGPIGSAVDQLFEYCLYHHNGDPGEAGKNHNFYLGGTSVTLRGCEVHSPITGHNFKSRAHFNWIEFCYIHDSLNREFDLVDSSETAVPDSHTVLLGNLIVKDPNSANHDVIHFGQDGGKEHNGVIYLIHNTILATTRAMLLDLSAPKASARLIGNVIDGGGTLINARNGADARSVTVEDNWLGAGFAGSAATSRGNTFGKPGARIEFTGRTDFRIQHPPHGIIGGGQAEDSWGLPVPPYPSLAKVGSGISRTSGAGSRSTVVGGPPPLKPLKPPSAQPDAGASAGANLLVWQYQDPARREPRAFAAKPDLGATDQTHKPTVAPSLY